MEPITAKSYFSGAGGMDLGLSLAGIQIVQSLELDPNACRTLEYNGSHRVIQMDIREIEVRRQEPTHLIVGTYPCTRYSSIADLTNNRIGDDLFLHLFRHIAIEQPEAYVVENVPGMKKFPVVMEAMSKLPNYYVNILCPVNSLNWLPQSRPRLILIGTKRPFTLNQPEVSERPILSDLLDPWDGEPIIESIRARMEGNYRDKPIVLNPDNPRSYARTLLANYGKNKGHQIVLDPATPTGYRPFTVREYARLMGFPDTYEFYGSQTEQFRQIGNAVCVPLAQWIGSELMNYFKS